MSRYIEADAIEYHEIFEGHEFVRVAYGDDIDNTPTADVVEVVRCKYCKYYWKNWKDGESDDKVAVCLASPKDDAFCSEGERREDE